MACPVCVHERRNEIETQGEHLSLRQLERKYRLSRSSLYRHRQLCQHPAGTAGDTGDTERSPVPSSNPLAVYHVEV
jgi:hypothetical protein